MTRASNKRHKDKCQKYRTEGRRERNKKKKQERAARREEKLRERREKKLNEVIPKEGQKPVKSKRKRRFKPHDTPPYGNATEIQKWTSVMRKLDNFLEEQKKLLEEQKKQDKKYGAAANARKSSERDSAKAEE